MLRESDSIITKMYAHSILRLVYFERAKQTRIKETMIFLSYLGRKQYFLAFCRILDLLNYLTVNLLLTNYILDAILFYVIYIFFLNTSI